MNISASVSFQGGDVSSIMARVNEGVAQGVTEVATAIYNTSQELVAVDTGDLKESGAVTVDQSGNQVSAGVSYGTDHCVYVEFGTGQRGASSAGDGPGPYDPNWKGMPAQPYMRPAIDAHRDEATPTVADAIEAIL